MIDEAVCPTTGATAGSFIDGHGLKDEIRFAGAFASDRNKYGHDLSVGRYLYCDECVRLIKSMAYKMFDSKIWRKIV